MTIALIISVIAIVICCYCYYALSVGLADCIADCTCDTVQTRCSHVTLASHISAHRACFQTAPRIRSGRLPALLGPLLAFPFRFAGAALAVRGRVAGVTPPRRVLITGVLPTSGAECHRSEHDAALFSRGGIQAMDALVVRPHHKAAWFHFDRMTLGTRVNHQGASALLLVSLEGKKIRNYTSSLFLQALY